MLQHIAEKFRSGSPLLRWLRWNRRAPPPQSHPPTVPAKRRALSLDLFKTILVNTSKGFRNCTSQNDIVRFLLYWIALVGTCLTVFVFFALHMTVKPSQFAAPPVLQNDPFQPDVRILPLVLKTEYAYRMTPSLSIPPRSFLIPIGKSHCRGCFCRSGVEDDYYELVP